MKERLYSAYVQCVMTYGSETWATKVEDMHRLVRADKMMSRWMCGINLRNGQTNEKIRNRLGIVNLSDLGHQGD